jgi:hypothetical protein
MQTGEQRKVIKIEKNGVKLLHWNADECNRPNAEYKYELKYNIL